MIKNIVKFLALIQVMVILGIVLSFVFKTEIGTAIKDIASISEKQGVYVMDEEGNVQKNSSFGMAVTVGENNMTVTGTVKNDCMIDIGENVECVIFEDLQQNGHDIEVYTTEGSTVKVIFKGENEIHDIFASGGLTVEGDGNNAVLTLTNSIYVCASELSITGGTINTPQLYSDGAITITGDSRIYLKKMEDQDEYAYARLEAYGPLTIDLDGQGILDIEVSESEDICTTYSPEKIIFGENTEITTPEDGYCDLYDPAYEDEYAIFDANGEEALHVVIEGK